MTRNEIIRFFELCPNCLVSHHYFGDDEYLYSRSDGKVYDENDYLFEDWTSQMHCGIRLREGGAWEDGWKALSLMERKPDGHSKWYSKNVFPEMQADTYDHYVFSVDVVGYDGSKYFKAYYSFTDKVWFNGEVEEVIDNLLMWAYGPDIESK